MSFDLRIEFSGLCLFVVRRDDRSEHRVVHVLMPDARKPLSVDTVMHDDGTPAVPHAGYLRFDLADFHHDLPGIEEDGVSPRYEGVHRFGGESVDLGIRDDPSDTEVDELLFPNFKTIDRRLTLLPRLLAGQPPNPLLMRMRLTGGRFMSHSGGSNWTFPSIATEAGHVYQGQFANFAVWTREKIDQRGLDLTFTTFADGKSNKIPLRSKNGRPIRLKVANLCAENPLEWPELKIRVIETEEDLDFKWLYSLYDNRETVIPDPGDMLPVPVLDRTSGAAGREQDCTGGLDDGTG
jgi:hypothetical protein